MNIRSRLTGIATGDQAIFVRKSVFEQIGGFAEIPLMEDIELSKRLKKLGRPACLKARVTSGRRWETDGLCKIGNTHVEAAALVFSGEQSESTGETVSGYSRWTKVKSAFQYWPRHRFPVFLKTRLIPLLGEDGAAKLQARFIERTVETAREAAVGPITIWYTPTEWGEYFARYSCLSSVRLGHFYQIFP